MTVWCYDVVVLKRPLISGQFGDWLYCQYTGPWYVGCYIWHSPIVAVLIVKNPLSIMLFVKMLARWYWWCACTDDNRRDEHNQPACRTGWPWQPVSVGIRPGDGQSAQLRLPACKYIDLRTVTTSDDWLIGWLIGWLIDWLIDWFSAWNIFICTAPCGIKYSPFTFSCFPIAPLLFHP